MYLLDSDICIHLMRGNLPMAYELMRKSDPRMFGIPAVVEGELRTGARKSQHPQENKLLLERFLAPFECVAYDHACSVVYGDIRAALESQGCIIGPNDLLIAATAIANQATLITGNVREFERVPGLSLESWAEGRL